MSLTCTHCTRLNPREAVFCYHDGQPLAVGGAVQPAPGVQRFPTALVLPSGQQCWNFDQLALACQEQWATAAAMLQHGHLEQFLAKLGRIDLALAARGAAAFPDRDRGLDQFLARLPSQSLRSPLLKTSTSEFNLGIVTTKRDQQVELRLTNGGMRLLHGTIGSDSPWLLLGEGQSERLFQCTSEVTLVVRVVGKRLRAGTKAQEGRLVINSSGGSATVVVRLEVPAQPFAHGVLAGATTPRQLAEKARKAPRAAAGCFEDGSVARWYSDNGWVFPIQGRSAMGVGAVQQFFEALGLAKPPKVTVPEPAIHLRGRPGETLLYPLRLAAVEKRPLHATGVSDQPWLDVGKAILNGSLGTLPLQVTSVPPRSGEMLQANVTVTANGGQCFVVPVSLAIGASLPASAVTALPVDTAVLPPAPAMPARTTPERKRSPSMTALHLLALAPLLILLMVILALDVHFGTEREPVTITAQIHNEDITPATAKNGKAEAKGSAKTAPASATIGPPVYKVDVKDEPPDFTEAVTTPLPVKFEIIDEKEERPPVKVLPVKVDIKDSGTGIVPAQPGKELEVDKRPRVLWQYGPNMRFGITAIDTKKLLTYAADGNTNQTWLRVNGEEAEFGSKVGRFVEKDLHLPPDADGKTFGGSRSVWISGKIIYTQILELVPNKQPTVIGGQRKLPLDTVRVRYVIENKEFRAYKIGLRIQVDTLIGANDGVPFTVPGLPGLVAQFADFPKAGPIPDFIQALEQPSLQNPGTVAHLSLKLGSKIEAPQRVSLTHWPGPITMWDVPLAPLSGDSAVVLYWNEKMLKPGDKREMGFEYGLGSVASTDPGGKLGITLGGSFEPGEAFAVTAYVQNPTKGQTLTLEVPDGLERVDGQEKQIVPPAAVGSNNTSIVTWKVKVGQVGTFPLKVVSSNGLTQTKTISIAREEGEGERRLKVDLAGSFEPGQEFTVRAKLESTGSAQVPEPTLTVPTGLVQTETPLFTKPTMEGSTTTREAIWKIKVMACGKYPIRVDWHGAVTTKTISIVRPDPPPLAGGYVTMDLAPPFAPGQAFTVAATVNDPLPGQTLALVLPAGLRLVNGSEVVPVPTTEASSVLKWKVMVDKAGTFPLRLQSSAGLTLKKTISIEPRDETGGTFVLEHTGEIGPGKEFTVRAKVTSPVAGQKLTLKLPAGLELVDGTLAQAVPATSVVTWRIRMTAGDGTMQLRVASTTGMARALTIVLTVEQPGQAPTLFSGKR
jgi:hypothetical protein